jgi:hypothetical protein
MAREWTSIVPRKLTTDEWIQRAKSTHGSRYDYSKVIYNGQRQKVVIVCLKHGDFSQIPEYHSGRGIGCPKCGTESMKEKQSLDLDKVIERAKEVHGDYYDYSLVNYVNTKTPVTIICPKHGKFEQTIDSHIGKKSGCKKCGKERSAEKQRGIPREYKGKRTTTEEFIARAKARHGEKYDYSRTVFKGDKIKVEIGCPIHGFFWQDPRNHTHKGGCGFCGGRRMTQEMYVQNVRELHGDVYDYSKIVYEKSGRKILVGCKIHGDFEIKASHFSQGHGCASCQLTGFNPSEPGYYYVNEILNESDDHVFFKAGISNDWEHRLKLLSKTLPNHLTIRHLEHIWFEIGKDANDLETVLLQTTSIRYPKRDFPGGSELFRENPLTYARDNGILTD